MSPPPPGFPLALARFGHMGGWPYELTVTPPVDPPPTGFLPFADGDPLGFGVAPYMVYFYLSGSYTGIEGMLLSDGFTVLTSAYAADYLLTNYKNITAKAGGTLLTGADCDQSVGLNGGGEVSPSWSGPGDDENDWGFVITDGFIFNANVNYIDYSAAVDSTPYSGDYFIPVSTIVAVGGMLKFTGGVPATDDANGSETNIISNFDAGTLLGITVGDAVISIDTAGKYYSGYGSPLVAAGYGSYYAAGVHARVDNGLGAALYCRLSYHSNQIEMDTGISPIIYP